MSIPDSADTIVTIETLRENYARKEEARREQIRLSSRRIRQRQTPEHKEAERERLKKRRLTPGYREQREKTPDQRERTNARLREAYALQPLNPFLAIDGEG